MRSPVSLLSTHYRVMACREYQQSDPVLGILINGLQSGDKRFLNTNPAVHQWSTKRDFLSLGKDDGLLYVRYKIGKHLVNQVVVSDALIPFVLRLKHDNAGHMAAEKTTSLIRCEYFWLNMVRDVTYYCRSRVPRARNRPSPSTRVQALRFRHNRKNLGRRLPWILETYQTGKSLCFSGGGFSHSCSRNDTHSRQVSYNCS